MYAAPIISYDQHRWDIGPVASKPCRHCHPRPIDVSASLGAVVSDAGGPGSCPRGSPRIAFLAVEPGLRLDPLVGRIGEVLREILTTTVAKQRLDRLLALLVAALAGLVMAGPAFRAGRRGVSAPPGHFGLRNAATVARRRIGSECRKWKSPPIGGDRSAYLHRWRYSGWRGFA